MFIATILSVIIIVLTTAQKQGENLNSTEYDDRFKQSWLMQFAVSKGPLDRPDSLLCVSCKSNFEYLIRIILGGTPSEEIRNYILMSCVIAFDPVYCNNMLRLELPPLIHMIRANERVNAEKICAVVLQSLNCFSNKVSNWIIPIPGENFISLRKYDSFPLKALHLTNIHVEELYEAGSTSDCRFPVCCIRGFPTPDKPALAAGYWGNYKCDIPHRTFKSIVEENTFKYDIDVVYFTGGVVSHRNWDINFQNHLLHLELFYEKLKKRFGKVKIFPVLDKHDTFPHFLFSPQFSTYVFKKIAQLWSMFLPKETIRTISHGGFYTTMIKTGLRVIGLNSNVCHTMNIANLRNDEDPFGQLSWLVSVLSKAEQKGEYVHILASTEPGNSFCIQAWSRTYHAIVERFRNIISAQIMGGSYTNGYKLFYSSDYSKIVNMAYLGGSISTYYEKNPSYLVHTFGVENYALQDIEMFYFNLSTANENPAEPLTWTRAYSFSEQFNVYKMEYGNMEDLVKRMFAEVSVMKQFINFKYAFGTDTTCDTNCAKAHACAVVTTRVGDYKKCEELFK